MTLTDTIMGMAPPMIAADFTDRIARRGLGGTSRRAPARRKAPKRIRRRVIQRRAPARRTVRRTAKRTTSRRRR